MAGGGLPAGGPPRLNRDETMLATEVRTRILAHDPAQGGCDHTVPVVVYVACTTWTWTWTWTSDMDIVRLRVADVCIRVLALAGGGARHARGGERTASAAAKHDGIE